MLTQTKFAACVIGLYTFFFWVVAAGSTELIEPTRTLTSESERVAKGQLTVLSEPPGLRVFVDGAELGETPVFMYEIDSGKHVIQVENQKTSVRIDPGKSTRISLFKGYFVETVVKKERPDHSGPSAAKIMRKPEIEKPAAVTDPPQSPYYWPLNPVGPIY